MKNRLLSLLVVVSFVGITSCSSGKYAHKTKMTKQFHKKEKVGHTPKKGNVFQRLFSSN